MNIRTTVEADLDTIHALIDQQSVNTVTRQRYDDFIADGTYRNDWTWVAEENGEIQALAIWWGPPNHDHPFSIDGLYYAGDGDPVPVWTALIEHTVKALPEPPEYHFFLSNDWRDHADGVAELEQRKRAAVAAGLTEVTERLRYEWKPEYGLPPRSTRLRFEPADDEAFVDVFRRVSEGSLDASTARAVARLGVDGAAREELEMYMSMPGERSWWRLAYDDGGKLIGFAIPSANGGGPVVGYLGVLAEHRGHRYSDDLLAEITHLLAETGAEQIRADTDFGNVPMARSFERLGYRNFAVRLVLSFPS
ncbi:acetyltransferase (GNAT) family protein [Kribbella antiqua]|uniref:Acetyltransferase (GNAT) family protein n=1 Tax=Kribbella antiqua TaxID=2512217 RepID=A0A4R2J0E6_9ACTN|nr:GNAT family N-acetyltransferase [Kribbella antiqua]TCO48695.1 acetyltransferase (GNAT) family protein [Kribbella antiqua]